VGSSYCGDWLLIGSELLTEEMKQKNGGGLWRGLVTRKARERKCFLSRVSSPGNRKADELRPRSQGLVRTRWCKRNRII
jgi:hypothetical protein